MPVSIAHLSDIHFQCDPDQIGHDPNSHMRDELVDDLEREAGKLGGLSALVISGDIAYGGRKAEFDLAAQWIKAICNRTGCPIDKVFVCPGNHDVDRDVLKEKTFIEDSHKVILSAANNEQRNGELTRRLKLAETRANLYKPLENYNNFALPFDCCFHADANNYAWSRDLVLDDGSVLRIRGLNSALLSGHTDKKRTLFLGRSAWSVGREPGVEYLAFAHHPPVWLADGDDMVGEFDDKVRIQLYGHEHDQRIVQRQGTVALFAGAVNPHRSEPNWLPGYNIVQVGVDVREGQRFLQVRIHAREWQDKVPKMFKPYAGKGHDMAHEHEFLLRAWAAPAEQVIQVRQQVRDASPAVGDSGIHSRESATQPASPPTMAQVLYSFMELERDRQQSIMGALGLEQKDEAELPDFLRTKKALNRAKERGLLHNLFEMTKAEIANGR
ncbi:metallophosphoesterase [Ralstonia nicotianae]